MASLDEILALLPDNDTGEITAASMREVITALYMQDEALATRIASLESAPDSSVPGIGITGFWQFNPQPGQVPGGKQMTASNVPLNELTVWIRFDQIDQQNIDMKNALTEATRLYLQMKSDASQWARFDVNGPVVDNGTYIHVPVHFDSKGGLVGVANWQDGIVIIRNG